MGLFTTKKKYREPAEWGKARKSLLEIGQTKPVFDVKQTAGMSDTEMGAQDLLGSYANNESPEVTAALASLGRDSQYQNLMDVPEYKALYETGQRDINNQLNRLGRTLQLKGNTNTSTGANVMANEIGDLNTQLMGSLSPFAAQERERRANAPIQAAAIKEADTQNRLAAVKAYGALPRELEQLSMDAEAMTQYLNTIAPYQYQVPALSAAGGIGNATITGGEKKPWAEWASLIGNAVGGAVQGGAKGGWGGAIAGAIGGVGKAASDA